MLVLQALKLRYCQWRALYSAKSTQALTQGWEFAHQFSERIACFLPKIERMSDLLRKTTDSLIFLERPERFAHGHSFLVSDLSDSLASITKKEGMNESLIF